MSNFGIAPLGGIVVIFLKRKEDLGLGENRVRIRIMTDFDIDPGEIGTLYHFSQLFLSLSVPENEEFGRIHLEFTHLMEDLWDGLRKFDYLFRINESPHIYKPILLRIKGGR